MIDILLINWKLEDQKEQQQLSEFASFWTHMGEQQQQQKKKQANIQ